MKVEKLNKKLWIDIVVEDVDEDPLEGPGPAAVMGCGGCGGCGGCCCAALCRPLMC